MPGYTGVHIDRALTNVSLYYRNESYIADKLAPQVPVSKWSDKYFVYGRENFRIPVALRAARSETREIQWSLSTDSYYCEEYGFHSLIDNRERQNQDEPIDIDADTAEYLTEMTMLDYEYRVANTVLDNTNPQWGAYASTHFGNLSAAWDDVVGADPRSVFIFVKWLIFRDSRRRANQAFIPVEVSMQLQQMDQIEELRKYTDPNLLTDGGLPQKLWGLHVNECASSYNNAEEGATDTYAETFGTNIVVTHTNPGRIGRKSLTFMLTFQVQPPETRRWKEEKKKSDAIEVTRAYDVKLVAPACGYVIANTMTQAA